MPSVSATYGQRAITDAQRRRLFAIALGTQASVGALAGSKRHKLNQLNEMLGSFGYDWDAVDEMCNPSGWIRVADYDELIAQLEVIRGGAM